LTKALEKGTVSAGSLRQSAVRILRMIRADTIVPLRGAVKRGDGNYYEKHT
jgi:hypothetical protein